jgi:hypothetical protein
VDNRDKGVAGPRAFWRIVRRRDFGPYFLGNALSASGTWFQNLAAALLIYRLTHSALLLGVLNFSQFMPILVLTPWAGSLADQVDRLRASGRLPLADGGDPLLARGGSRRLLSLPVAAAWVRAALRRRLRLPRLEHCGDDPTPARRRGAAARADHGALEPRLPRPPPVREPAGRRDRANLERAGRGGRARDAGARGRAGRHGECSATASRSASTCCRQCSVRNITRIAEKPRSALKAISVTRMPTLKLSRTLLVALPAKV